MNDGFLKSLLEKLPGSWQIDQGKALAFGHTAAADLPECNVTRENEHRYIRGAAGVADRMVVCEKDAANAYAWQDKGDAYLDATYSAGAHNHDSTYVNVTGDTMTGRLDGMTFRSTSDSDPTSGVGLELVYNEGTSKGYLVAYDRDASAYKELHIDASSLGMKHLEGTGTRVVEANSAGVLTAANRQAWVWLSEDTFTGVTEFIKDSILTTTYDEYELVCTIDNLSTAAAGALFQWRAAGATKNGAVYYGGYTGTSNVAAGGGVLANGSTSFSFAHAGGNLNRSISVTLKTYRPAVARAANEALVFHMATAQHRQGTDVRTDIMGGGYLDTHAMDGFRISASAGNLVGGTARVYGRRKN